MDQTTEQPQDLSTNPQEISTVEQQTPEVQQEVSGEVATGEIVEEKPKHPGGRLSKYDEDKATIARDYYLECLEGRDIKNTKGEIVNTKKLPLMEELARLCDVDGETLNNWCKEHEEFFDTVKRIKELQKERIVNKGFLMSNPTFAIFMLKANHGMIETEKRILAGERNGEPVQITVNEYTPGQKAVPSGIAVDQLSE